MLSAKTQIMNHPHFDAIRAHIEQYLDAPAAVWDEDGLDIFVVAPTESRPFLTLITAGMSDEPMDAPKAEWKLAELCFLLPAAWPLEREQWGESHEWTLLWLQYLAKYPRETGGWLGYGHTIPNGEPPQPLDVTTEAVSVMLIPPVSLPEKFARLRVNETDEGIINFWALVPLLPDELRMKMQSKTPVLLEKMEKAKLSDILDPGRRSVLASRGLKKFLLG